MRARDASQGKPLRRGLGAASMGPSTRRAQRSHSVCGAEWRAALEGVSRHLGVGPVSPIPGHIASNATNWTSAQRAATIASRRKRAARALCASDTMGRAR